MRDGGDARPRGRGAVWSLCISKPYSEQWSAEALAASGGKSFGAVRAMHGPVAAGKLTDIAFDDDAKRITVAAKIVDDDELWRKVRKRRRGVYTGFSQGGRYVKRWPDADTGLTRYTAEPHEISLVDLPCVRDATFEVVKERRCREAGLRRASRRGPGAGSRNGRRHGADRSNADAIEAALGTEKREFLLQSVRKTPRPASPCPMAPIRSSLRRTSRTP